MNIPYNLPELNLGVDFFFNKKNTKFTGLTLSEHLFGEKHTNMTEAEKVFLAVNALQSLKLVMTIDAKCKHCNFKNTFIVNLCDVMQTTGHPYQEFDIDVDDLKLVFRRPEVIPEISNLGSPLAESALYMISWLAEHNQGDDFDFTKLPLTVFTQIAEKFADTVFNVSFPFTGPCHKCKENYDSQLVVDMQTLAEFVNEM